jgi:hypothetical protein
MSQYNQYPLGTEYVYSYFESREGMDILETVFLNGVLLKDENFEDIRKRVRSGMCVDISVKYEPTQAQINILDEMGRKNIYTENGEYFSWDKKIYKMIKRN